MKCKFCGCEEFIGHQVVHMDVLVDRDGDFLDNLSGGYANIYESKKPFGPFNCCRCGAEYEELTEGAEPISEPMEGSLGPDRNIMSYNGITFRKTHDFYFGEYKRKFQRWESAEYNVRISAYDGGCVDISIIKTEQPTKYLPTLTVDTTNNDKCTPQNVSVQTTSYGSLPLSEIQEVNRALEIAIDYAKAIKELFIYPIRDGKFGAGGWKPQDPPTA